MDTKEVLKTASMGSMMPIFFMIFGIVVVIGLIWYIRQLAMNTASNACYRLSKQERVTTLSSISTTDFRYNLPLHSFMIKTSYNSCATGPFKRSWVDLCALTSVISQGCRVLDFEVYNIHGEPAVAASATVNFYEKGTFNSIPFIQVIQCIAENAFTSSKCPNSNDPLFLNFRIKSANKDIYNKMALALEKLDDRMLSSEYSYEYLKDKTSSNLSNVSASKRPRMRANSSTLILSVALRIALTRTRAIAASSAVKGFLEPSEPEPKLIAMLYSKSPSSGSCPSGMSSPSSKDGGASNSSGAVPSGIAGAP